MYVLRTLVSCASVTSVGVVKRKNRLQGSIDAFSLDVKCRVYSPLHDLASHEDYVVGTLCITMDDSCIFIEEKRPDDSCIILTPPKTTLQWDNDEDILTPPKTVSHWDNDEDTSHSPDKRKKQRQIVKETASRATENCVAIIDQRILDLIKDHHGDLLRAVFDENNCRFRLSQSTNLPSSIMWVRIRKETSDGGAEESFSSSQPATFSLDASSCVREFEEPEPKISVVLSAEDFINKLNPCNRGSSTNQGEQPLDEFIDRVKHKSSADHVTLIVYNLAAHFKRQRQKKDREFQARFKQRFGGPKRAPSDSADLCGIDVACESSSIIDYAGLRQAKNELMFRYNKLHPDMRIGLWFLDATEEVVQTICKQTVSIAKAPFRERSRRQDGIDWAIEGDRSSKPVDPANSEEDLKVLWISQLQQFSSVTLTIAQQIAMKYPSPMSLVDAYAQCSNDQEASALLTSITYKRNGRQNNVSHAASEMIHKFFSSDDPDLVLCTS